MDYGQHVLLSTGNFLCSAPSLNSTMDFSKKPMEGDVVDSVLERKSEQFPVLDLPFEVSAMDVQAPPLSLSTIVRLMQRKVYGDANYSNVVPEVLATFGKDSHAVLSLLSSCTLHGGRCSAPSTAQSIERKRDVWRRCTGNYSNSMSHDRWTAEGRLHCTQT